MKTFRDVYGKDAFTTNAGTTTTHGRPFVSLSYFAGPLNFFAMVTPATARELADELLALADEAEQRQQVAA